MVTASNTGSKERGDIIQGTPGDWGIAILWPPPYSGGGGVKDPSVGGERRRRRIAP